MNRQGMTLIELLAALTLSAMLMAVLLGMVSQQTRVNRQLQTEKPFLPWISQLKTQIQSDYAGCRHILFESDRIVINGYSRLDSDRTGLISGPSEIHYYIVSTEDENLLYRQRVNLLSNQTDRTTRELVCRQVNRFRLPSRLSTDVAPGVLRLELELSDRDTPVKLALVRHGVAQ